MKLAFVKRETLKFVDKSLFSLLIFLKHNTFSVAILSHVAKSWQNSTFGFQSYTEPSILLWWYQRVLPDAYLEHCRASHLWWRFFEKKSFATVKPLNSGHPRFLKNCPLLIGVRYRAVIQKRLFRLELNVLSVIHGMSAIWDVLYWEVSLYFH